MVMQGLQTSGSVADWAELAAAEAAAVASAVAFVVAAAVRHQSFRAGREHWGWGMSAVHHSSQTRRGNRASDRPAARQRIVVAQAAM